MKTSYVPIQTAIGSFINDFGIKETEIDEELLTIWAEDAIAEISTDEQLCLKIGIVDVVDYKAELPKDFKIACEIAYRKAKPEGCPTRREELVKFTQKAGKDCELDIHIRCPKCHKEDCKGCGKNSQQPVYVEVDRIWELANSYYKHSTQFMTNDGVQTFGRGQYPSMYDNSFKLMSPTDSSWFQISKHIPNCANICCPLTEHTYMIHNESIEVDFKKGEILISYLAKYTDDNGNLMIPDHRNAIEAVTAYMGMKYFRRKMLMSNNDRDATMKYQILSQESDIAIGRARSVLQIPDIKDWTNWLKDNRYQKLDGALDNFYHGRDRTCDTDFGGVPNTRRYGSNDKYRN